MSAEQNAPRKSRAGIVLAIVVLTPLALIGLIAVVNTAYRVGITHQTGAEPQGTVASTDRNAAPQVIASDSKIINERQWQTVPFSLSRAAQMTVHVALKGGPPVYVYLVGDTGLNAWEAAAQTGHLDQFQDYPAVRMAPLATEYTRDVNLAAGQYALIIANLRPGFHLFRRPAFVDYQITAQ